MGDESLLIGCVSMTIILVVLLLLCSCYGQSVQTSTPGTLGVATDCPAVCTCPSCVTTTGTQVCPTSAGIPFSLLLSFVQSSANQDKSFHCGTLLQGFIVVSSQFTADSIDLIMVQPFEDSVNVTVVCKQNCIPAIQTLVNFVNSKTGSGRIASYQIMAMTYNGKLVPNPRYGIVFPLWASLVIVVVVVVVGLIALILSLLFCRKS